MHASAATRIEGLPRVRSLRSLVAFFLLAFGLLSWTEEADARFARDARFADSERAIGLSQPALARQAEIPPHAAQPVYPAGSLGGLFSRPGVIGGFTAGFLGAGIFGLLFGHGFIGEVNGVASILGLVFQFGLLLALGWAIGAWWRADKAGPIAQLSPRQLADAYERARNETLPDVAPDMNGKAGNKNSFADEAHLPL